MQVSVELAEDVPGERPDQPAYDQGRRDSRQHVPEVPQLSPPEPDGSSVLPGESECKHRSPALLELPVQAEAGRGLARPRVVSARATTSRTGPTWRSTARRPGVRLSVS